MREIRVLVVEDSLTVRRYLCDLLNGDPDIQVVGEAADGETAIRLCEALRPDVITMDMILEGASGLYATEHIMTHHPTPILIVSASTNRGELISTYEALAAGAVDVLEKPEPSRVRAAWELQFRDAVKIVAKVRAIRRPRLGTRRPPRTPSVTNDTGGLAKLVAIGTSTGGPTALVQVLGALPKSYSIPVLVVLHIAEAFAHGFADWLDSHVAIRVRFARNGERLVDLVGTAVLAPPNQHMALRSGRIHLDDGPERHSCRPAVDVLFESVAESGLESVGCLLTGMGRDGASGLALMRRRGALTIAQDEATSTVFGMPREAIRLDAASLVLPLSEIGPHLQSLGQPPREAPR